MYEETHDDLVQGWLNTFVIYNSRTYAVTDVVSMGDDNDESLKLRLMDHNGNIEYAHKEDVKSWWPEPGYYNLNLGAVYLKLRPKKQYKASYTSALYSLSYANPTDMYIIGLSAPTPTGCVQEIYTNKPGKLIDINKKYGVALNRNVAVANFIFAKKPVILVHEIIVGYMEGNSPVLAKAYPWAHNIVTEAVNEAA